MPGGLTLLASLPAAIPTPPAGKITLFFNTTANAPYYKDSAGSLFPFVGAAGNAGSFIIGNDGEDGPESLIPGPPGNSQEPLVVALVDGATPALNASLGGRSVTVFTLSAAGDRTIGIPTNPTNGQKIIIRHFANGGARTLALNAGAGGFRFGSDITALTATASGKTDYIGCIYSSIDNFWDVVAVTKGF